MKPKNKPLFVQLCRPNFDRIYKVLRIYEDNYLTPPKLSPQNWQKKYTGKKSGFSEKVWLKSKEFKKVQNKFWVSSLSSKLELEKNLISSLGPKLELNSTRNKYFDFRIGLHWVFLFKA